MDPSFALIDQQEVFDRLPLNAKQRKEFYDFLCLSPEGQLHVLEKQRLMSVEDQERLMQELLDKTKKQDDENLRKKNKTQTANGAVAPA